MTDLNTIEGSLRQALLARGPLIERLAAERTDCLRLFHGTQEGAPGVTVDRYGDLVLLQSFHEPLPEAASDVVARGRRLPSFPQVERESFDVVFLDPPARAMSRFGVVDVIRDYQSMMKPALAAVVENGALYCTNNSAVVDEAEWHSLLRRCADKHGRPIRSLDVIRPGEDFPSTDNRPPLKVARLGL